MGQPNPLVRWWEARSRRTQALIAIPTLSVLLFAINRGPFNQPVWRSVIYGIFEGGILGGLVLVVTAQEQAKRAARGGSAAPEERDARHDEGHRGDSDGPGP